MRAVYTIFNGAAAGAFGNPRLDIATRAG